MGDIEIYHKLSESFYLLKLTSGGGGTILTARI